MLIPLVFQPKNSSITYRKFIVHNEVFIDLETGEKSSMGGIFIGNLYSIFMWEQIHDYSRNKFSKPI